MKKSEMLEIMNENKWSHDLDEKSSYEDVKEEFEVMKDELLDDYVMYPNGRDYDAEDFD
ncbi:hypothetical protein UT300009_21310 [Paraclostridium bifermentans]